MIESLGAFRSKSRVDASLPDLISAGKALLILLAVDIDFLLENRLAQKALRRSYITTTLVSDRSPKLIVAEFGHATGRWW